MFETGLEVVTFWVYDHDGQFFKPVKAAKDLGVTLDSNLTFKPGCVCHD